MTLTKEGNKKSRPPPRDDGRVIKDSRSNKKRYEERYTSSTSCSSGSMRLRNNNNNDDGLREKCGVQKRKLLVSTKKGKLSGKVVDSSIIDSRKKMVDQKQHMICIEVQSDDQLFSRSPVSVLDGHLTKEISPFSKGEGRNLSSKSRRKSSPKIKINDNLPQDIAPKSTKNYQDYCNKIANKQELVKAEVEAAENFMEMLENICKLAGEEHIKKDTKWVKKYELLKVHFVEDLCIHLGQDLVDLLLDELLDEIVMAL
ncbi:uncharacterized protein [Spinacia oleracea]|uniref:DUF3741 domain-containing protein n=1 Tax=Spinacia oleracea TaxID=3562 RepID=A0A9R0IUT5_SPIOL|nr:uncharacterized protein LOC110794896 [Spinacia oleracea]